MLTIDGIKKVIMKLFVYLSEILNSKIVDCNDVVIGRLSDIAMRMSDEVYPRPEAYIARRTKNFFQKEYAHINVDDVVAINEDFKLKIAKEQIHFQRTHLKYDFTLGNDILDQQVVDTDHQKVVRVNDVHLLRIDNHLYPAHVDIGLRALLRRLGYASLVDTLIRLFSPKAAYLIREDFIPWKNTQVLTSGRYKNVLRLDVVRKKLSQIPPTELAEIMEDLDIFEQLSLFKSLDVDVQRKVFADLATQEKNDLIDHMDDREAVNLIENIPADEATDLLLSLPKDKTRQLMRLMESQTSKELRKLLGFAKDSAGGLMTTEYLSLEEDAKVKDALSLIKENVSYPGNIYHIYIVDSKDHLLGATSLRQFINEDPDKPILETCYSPKVFVRTDDGMEEIALLLEKYKFSSIPVLDEEDILQGVITTDDVMEELIALAWSKYKDKLV